MCNIYLFHNNYNKGLMCGLNFERMLTQFPYTIYFEIFHVNSLQLKMKYLFFPLKNVLSVAKFKGKIRENLEKRFLFEETYYSAPYLQIQL